MEFSAQQIAALLGGIVYGDISRAVSDVAPIETAQEGQLAFLCEEKYLPCLSTTKASVVLVTKGLLQAEPHVPATVIAVENARGAMAQLLRLVSEALNPRKKGIEQPVFVAEGVDVPADVYIGAYAYVGAGARIGSRVQIYPQVYIGEDVSIGEDTILYPGVKIYSHCHVGAHCILHAGVVVGADGFGFEPDAQGVNQKIPQIGNVVIEDDVEIGANTTIDRAMMGSTIIHRNTKIDNLVQVAHNVEIGESTFMCAQVGVAGSTKIGHHCILAGQVGVAGHLEITDQCVFGAKTGVASTIRQSGTYQGSPAIDAMNWRRSSIGFKQLPDILRRLRELEAQKS